MLVLAQHSPLLDAVWHDGARVALLIAANQLSWMQCKSLLSGTMLQLLISMVHLSGPDCSAARAVPYISPPCMPALTYMSTCTIDSHILHALVCGHVPQLITAIYIALSCGQRRGQKAE
jgi:hypothetical protein